MSFFKKVNDDTDSKKKEENVSTSSVESEISDLDQLLDKVLAEKEDRETPTENKEIHSIKAADLLRGKSDDSIDEESESAPEETKHDEIHEVGEDNTPVDDVAEAEDAEDILSDRTDSGSAADFLSEKEDVNDSAADILEDEQPVHEDTSSYSQSPVDSLDTSEDALLVQIDAFRDKAIRLSGLINANQKKVVSLETEVKKKEGLISEKEKQIAALQEELSQKQQEADALVTTVETQVDRMLVSVKREMGTLNSDLSGQISRENRAESEKLASVIDKVNSSVLEIKEYLEHSQDETTLDDVKEELSGKIHSENVKVYRNIQDTLKEMDHSEQMDISMDEKYRSLKHRSIGLLIVLIINLGFTAVVLLMNLGIIPENILSLLGI